ncbi:hypothetical protein B0H10DRAFT_2231389 [Mycena sp. CBHHK59/15]|nr:hypothetical protein B0H10DRAFT_2231389 [Mycena sp. CBHHK59/15]
MCPSLPLPPQDKEVFKEIGALTLLATSCQEGVMFGRASPRPRLMYESVKAFRAQASKAGLSYWAAVNASKELQASRKFEKPAGIIRRNPGRMDGVQWNGDSFVCATEVDDGLAPSRADIIDGAMEVEERA